MAIASVQQGQQAYVRLKAQVAAAGLFERSYVYYAGLATVTFAGYGLSLAAIYSLESYAGLALACLGFTAFSLQVAGLMHDSGHRAIFASIRNNDILGYICAALLGMVFDNWKTRHNMHHGHPNEEDLDPDMEIPFIATSEEFYRRKTGLQRRLIRYQAFYYFPLGSIVSVSNRLGTVTFFLHDRSWRQLWKLALWLGGFVLLFVAPFALFPLGKALFVFALVHVTTGVYLANCFAPNHKGMPEVRDKLSFIEQQVITARDVAGGAVTDTLLLCLNHQIEHHLFPYTPRNKLRRLKPLVRAACADLGIPFTEVSLLETNRILLRELGQVGRLARRSERPSDAAA